MKSREFIQEYRRSEQGVAEGLINESAIFLNPNAVIVGQEHGRPLDLSPETLKRVKAIAAKHGAWYEGDGGDRAYTRGQIDSYKGSWDDEVAKTASPDDPKWLYVLFANVKENRRIQRVGADPKDTIFNRLLVTAKDNSFQGMGFTAQALKKFLMMTSEGEYDFVRMSQQPATQENLAQFFKAGESLMWPANWEQYPNRAGKIARAATVGARDQYLANRKSGVYVVGSGHLKAVQQLTGKQGVAESLDQPYRIKWERSMHGDYDALAALDDGTYLSIMFNNQSKNNWMVEFYRNNRQEVTGEGDAQRVFATVLTAIAQFIEKKKPVSLFFSAVKEDDPKGSREKLYDRLVQRYAGSLGYTIHQGRTPMGSMAYKFTRKQQGVAESQVVDKRTKMINVGKKVVDVDGIKLNISGDGASIDVIAMSNDGGKQLGYVIFDRDGNTLVPDDLAVDERYRGQGIAKIMYDYIKSIGFKIQRSFDQTSAGKYFWDKNRGEDGVVWEENTIQELNENGGYVPVNSKEAKDPRFKMALSVDIKPGEIKRQAAKMGMKTDAAGRPPLLRK